MARARQLAARGAVPLMAALALAACSQDDAPADTVQQAMEETIDAAQGNAGPAPLARGRFAPRDECAGLPGATGFRQGLAAAVAARDADALAGLAASDVKLDSAGGGGVAQLRRRLDASNLWDELAAVLQMGCARNGEGGITLPWYANQDMAQADPASGMIVTGENVPVHALSTSAAQGASGPAASTSDQVGAVSWNVVSLVGGLQPGSPAQRVRLSNGKVGYIASDHLRSLVDYRLTAISRNGQWRIISLLAGD